MIKEINLLPPDRRRNLEREAFLRALQRMGRNVLLALLLVTVLGVGSLVAVKSIAAAEERAQDFNVREQVEEFRNLRDAIAVDNERLKLMLTQTEGRVLWSARLQELLDTLPPGVHVARLQGNDHPPLRQLVFSGTAVTRNALIVLERRLQELAWVERVEAPVSNLINRTDAEYVFTVRIKVPGEEKKGDDLKPSVSP